MSELTGTWNITITSLLGDQQGTLELRVDGDRVTGTARNAKGSIRLGEGTMDGETASIPIELTQPMQLHAVAKVSATGDTLKGKITGVPIPGVRISGTRVPA